MRPMDEAGSDVLVPASPEETWEAITDPDQLGGWLAGEAAELDLVPGGDLQIDEPAGFVEEGAVGVFDGVFLLARGPLLEVIEIGLAAQSEITEAIEIGLQADKGIIAIVLGRLLGRDYGALLIR